MAKANQVVADQSSVEVLLLRKAVNRLLLLLENVASQVHAGDITADEAFTALNAALSSGLDSSITGIDGGANDYVGSGVPVLGVKATPRVPEPARSAITTALSVDSDS